MKGRVSEMEIECILKLNQCKQQIIDSLEFDLISPSLIQHGVICKTEYEELRDVCTNKEKVDRLLKLLLRKPNIFDCFVKSCEEDYDWIAFALKNAHVSPEQIEKHNSARNLSKAQEENFCQEYNQERRKVNNDDSDIINKYRPMSASQTSSSNLNPEHRMNIRDWERRHERTNIRNPYLSGASPLDFDDRGDFRDDMRSTMYSHDKEFGLDVERRRLRNETDINPRNYRDFYNAGPNQMYRRGGRLDFYDQRFVHDSFGPGYDNEYQRHDTLDRMDTCDNRSLGRTPSQESLDRLCFQGRRKLDSPNSVKEFGSVSSPTSGGFGSPLHSSEFSLKSSDSGDDRLDSLSQVGEKRKKDMDVEITEEMIEFVMQNPRVMRKWQSLAHSVGMSHRVEVIKDRVRRDGRDLDENVAEFLREWIELKPEVANLGGLINLLKSQNFNDTALKLEEGSYKKRRV